MQEKKKEGGGIFNSAARQLKWVYALMELMASVCKQEKNVSDTRGSAESAAGCMLPHSPPDRIFIAVSETGRGEVIVIIVNLVMASSPGLFCA